MKAVLQRVCLEELRPGAGVEEKALGPRADEFLQHRRQGSAKVHVPFPVLGLQIRLDSTALRFLSYVERAAILADMLANLEPEGFADPQWTTAGQ